MVANGTPRPSVSTWRLLPSLPRSVGFGPTAAAGVRVLGAVAPSPDSHRRLAKPTGCPALARTAAGTPPTDGATPRSSPTAESGHAPWLPSQTRLAVLATGSPSATHTAPRPVPGGCPSTAARLWGAPPAVGSARRSSTTRLALARLSAAPLALPRVCSSSTSGRVYRNAGGLSDRFLVRLSPLCFAESPLCELAKPTASNRRGGWSARG